MENKTNLFIVKISKFIANILIISIVVAIVLFCLIFIMSMNQVGGGTGPNFGPIFAIFGLFLCALFSIIPIRLYMMNGAIKRYELQNQPEEALRVLKNLKITSIVLVVVFIVPFIYICMILFYLLYILFTGGDIMK